MSVRFVSVLFKKVKYRGYKIAGGRKQIRLHGQAVKTSPFHGGNTGSIPVGVIFLDECSI